MNMLFMKILGRSGYESTQGFSMNFFLEGGRGASGRGLFSKKGLFPTKGYDLCYNSSIQGNSISNILKLKTSIYIFKKNEEKFFRKINVLQVHVKNPTSKNLSKNTTGGTYTT